MFESVKSSVRKILLRSQSYTGTDNLYVASHSFWTSLNFVVVSLFSLALVFFLANFLPKEIYGTYKYAMSIIGSLGFLTLSGMATAVTQAVARGHDEVLHYAIKVQLKWNLLFLGAAVALGTYYLINGNSTVGTSLFILGLVFPFIDAFNTFGPFLSGKREFKRLALWGILTNGIYTAAMIVAILFGKSVIALVIAYTMASLISTLYLYRKTVRIFAPPKNGHPEKEFLTYGLHLSFVNVFATLSQYVDKIVIFHFLGAVELAIYGLALAIPEKIRGYVKGLNSIVLPKLSEKTMRDIWPVFYKRVAQGMAIGALISVGYILVAPPAFTIFLPQYLESVRYSQVISLSFIAILPISYIGSVFRAQKMLKTIYLSSTTFHVLKIILFIVFGALWHIWGVIYASLLVYAIGLIYYMALWEFEVEKYKKSAPLDPL